MDDNKTVPESNKSSAYAEWPGSFHIIKRSIIDFFTNIVPWLVGCLAFVPFILTIALVVGVGIENGNGSTAALNAVAILLGIIGVVSVIFVALCWIASTPIYGLARADGKKMTTREVYTLRGSITLRLVLAGIVLAIPIIIGFFLLIIPGLILLIWLLPTITLVPYVIVEEDMGVMDSIKAAHRLSKGHVGKIWMIYICFFLLSLILIIPIIILIVVIIHNMPHHSVVNSNSSGSGGNGTSGGFSGGGPLTAISFAYLYRWIKQQPAPQKSVAPAS